MGSSMCGFFLGRLDRSEVINRSGNGVTGWLEGVWNRVVVGVRTSLCASVQAIRYGGSK